jgi:hypothetical protein
MNNLLWENKILLCDICQERPMIKNIEISRGEWRGVCVECKPQGEGLKNQLPKHLSKKVIVKDDV